MSDDLQKRLDEMVDEISSIKQSVEQQFRNLGGYTARTEALLQAELEKLASKQKALMAAIEELHPGLAQRAEHLYTTEEKRQADEATARGQEIAESLLNRRKFRP